MTISHSKHESMLQDLFVIFNKFVYMYSFDNYITTEDAILDLLEYETLGNFPTKMVLQYTKEINEKMGRVLQQLFGGKQAGGEWWSLHDFIDMMAVNGANLIKDRASWNRYIRQNPLLASTATKPKQAWSSLSFHDENCLQNAVSVNFSKLVCSMTECQKFCQKMKSLLLVKHQDVQRLLLKTTLQQPTFSNRDDNDFFHTPLIPFCFYGDQLSLLLDQVQKGKNFQFDRDHDQFGYCKHGKYIITDHGMCITYNFPNYDLFRATLRNEMKTFFSFQQFYLKTPVST